MLPQTDDFKIPLVIGITGHRDIPKGNILNLKEKIEEIFNSLKVKYPDTPFILLSPLADGADRIVAEVALSNRFKDKITLSVPLPFDIKTYKATFGTNNKHTLLLDNAESIIEFDKMMTQVYKQKNPYVPKVIPMPYDGKNKNYSLVGEYIAIHSQILIALQNPCSEAANGGTAEIVNKKLNGEYIYVSDTQDNVSLLEEGLVYRILTPRIKDKERLNNRYKLTKLFPGNIEKEWKDKKISPFKRARDWIKNTLAHLFSSPCLKRSQQESMNSFKQEHNKINCFNSAVSKEESKIRQRAQSDIEKIISLGIVESDYQKHQDDCLIVKSVLTRRAAAFLSEKYQKCMTYLEWTLLSLIVFATFLFFVNALLPATLHKYKTITYLSVIVLFYILNTFFQKYKTLHEDTRAISEGLRVQTAWKIADIKESVAFSYPSSYKSDLNWIRTSLRALNIFHAPKLQTENTVVTCSIKKQISDYWIDEQINYFKKNIKKYTFKENIFKNTIFFLIFTALFSSLLFTVYTLINPNYIPTEEFKINKFFLVGLPFIALAFLKAKQAFNGYSKIIKQYELSLAHFSRAKTLLRNSSTNTVEIYKSLGIEALQENTFWTILRREKQYKSPTL